MKAAHRTQPRPVSAGGGTTPGERPRGVEPRAITVQGTTTLAGSLPPRASIGLVRGRRDGKAVSTGGDDEGPPIGLVEAVHGFGGGRQAHGCFHGILRGCGGFYEGSLPGFGAPLPVDAFAVLCVGIGFGAGEDGDAGGAGFPQMAEKVVHAVFKEALHGGHAVVPRVDGASWPTPHRDPTGPRSASGASSLSVTTHSRAAHDFDPAGCRRIRRCPLLVADGTRSDAGCLVHVLTGVRPYARSSPRRVAGGSVEQFCPWLGMERCGRCCRTCGCNGRAVTSPRERGSGKRVRLGDGDG